MERQYVDSNALIYFVERRDPWFSRLRVRLTSNPVRVVVSDLTRMECRVKPIQLGDMALIAEFDQAFALAEIAPLTAAVFDRATHIRATYRFKTPDSTHLAAAVESACSVFLTYDNRLASFPDIPVEVV